MQLNDKTLERLGEIINGDGSADYRSGPKLCDFFNSLGFSDDYWKMSRTIGFPSRKDYTIDKLKRINGTPELDKCIKNVFAVNNYIGRVSELDDIINDFNQYIAFDKWMVIRNNVDITFKKLDKVTVDVQSNKKSNSTEEVFLQQKFNFNIDSLGLEQHMVDIIKKRLSEIECCLKNKASLSAVIMIGGVLEGLLLAMATLYPRLYNQSSATPKDTNGNVRRFPDWTLNNFIDVSSEIGILNPDVKKFSHAVRDFRNYIHPYSQLASGFFPDEHTAIICFQVLNAALYQIEMFQKNNGG